LWFLGTSNGHDFQALKLQDSHVELLTGFVKGQQGQRVRTPQYRWNVIAGKEEKKKRERKGFELHALFTRVSLW
jgi:hypothetical protein